MFFLAWYTLLPAAFLFACAIQAWRKPGSFWRRAGVYGLLSYLLSFVIGVLAIFASRSSTAGIGLLFLPMIALLPGVLGFVMGTVQFRLHAGGAGSVTRPLPLAVMLLSGLGLAGVLGSQSYGWYQTTQLNQQRDLEAQRQREAIESNRRQLAQRLAAAPGREGEIIDRMSLQTKERTWLIPLASNPHASPETLDRLSDSGDFGVALSALRNAHVPTHAIVRVYRNHSYPNYFFSTLAGNANSPDWLLRELYQKRQQNTGIAPALAKNPATPGDLLEILLNDADLYLLRHLVRNPGLDCRLLREVDSRIQAAAGEGREGVPAKRLAECAVSGG